MLKSRDRALLAFDGDAQFPVKLANTYDAALPEPELLKSLDDLKAFLAREGVQHAQKVNDQIFEDVLLTRANIRAVFLSSSADEASIQLNKFLEGVTVRVLAQQIDNVTLLHLEPSGHDSLADRIKSCAVLALAAAAQRYGFDRLRACKADPCRDMFIDTSRKGVQGFCCSRCASRKHVSDFRRRRAANASDKSTASTGRRSPR